MRSRGALHLALLGVWLHLAASIVKGGRMALVQKVSQPTQGKMSSPFCGRASELSWPLLAMCKTWIHVIGTYSISFVSVVAL